MAFGKEHLVIFFNPLQLEIQSAVIKLQFLWLPTFAPEAVSEGFTLHIQTLIPHHHPHPHHLLPLGSLISVAALHPFLWGVRPFLLIKKRLFMQRIR